MVTLFSEIVVTFRIFRYQKKESPHGVNTWSYYLVAEQQEKLTDGKLIVSLYSNKGLGYERAEEILR